MKQPHSTTRRAALASLLACAALLPTARADEPVPPQILNLHAAQRPGTMFVDITYDLIDPDSQSAYFLVECSANGGSTYSVPITALSGDIGFGHAGNRQKDDLECLDRLGRQLYRECEDPADRGG